MWKTKRGVYKPYKTLAILTSGSCSGKEEKKSGISFKKKKIQYRSLYRGWGGVGMELNKELMYLKPLTPAITVADGGFDAKI